MSIVDLGPIQDAVDAVLTTALERVYILGTPDSVDTTRPYIVLQWPPGGGPVGSAVRQNLRWEMVARIVAVAVSPDPSSTPPTAALAAARTMADAARQVILDPSVPIVGSDGAEVTGRGFSAAGGVQLEGNTVNITDDYLLTITGVC